jgi:methyl-accepting chemotaxis protein
MIRNLKVRTKIMVITGILLLLIILTGTTGFLFNRNSNQEVDKMYSVHLEGIRYLGDMLADANMNEAYVLYIVKYSGDTKVINDYVDKLKESTNQIKESLDAYISIGSITQREKDTLAVLDDSESGLLNIREQVIELAKDGKNDEAYQLYMEQYSYLENYRLAISDLLQYNNEKAKTEDALNHKELKRAELILIFIILISLLSGIVLSLLVVRTITKPLSVLIKLLKKVDTGDYNVFIPQQYLLQKDEIGDISRVTDKMLADQSHVISRIRVGAFTLSDASENIAASAQELNAASEEVTSNIQEVAAYADRQNASIIDVSETLVQLSSQIQIAQNKSITAKKNSAFTMQVAEQGRINVRNTVETIENINHISSEAEATLNQLNELSETVRGIIDMINNISAQTNLLALNAAIEAARAGEHGKGFTVVSAEIRKLSEQTSTGAEKISSLINEMVLHIKKAVSSMLVNKQAVENGVTVVKETDEAFIRIIDAVNQIGKDIEQITDITHDEVASSEQIVTLIDSVAGITELTTKNSHEVAAASEEQVSAVECLAASAEETSSMAEELKALVERFEVRGENQ